MMNHMQRMISLGYTDVIEVMSTAFIHPDIDVSGDLYLGYKYGEQRLLMVKDRQMDNSDGSEWCYPGQTKTCLYYLSHDEENGTFDWYYSDDL